jgi:hypothetical protein
MTQLVDRNPTEAAPETDLAGAVCQVLRASTEPLTLAKIRSLLPAAFRQVTPEDLAANLQRQVAANVLTQYPRYRSQQDRFWDRPMAEHIARLLENALQAGPLAWSELRRKLPAYAQGQAEPVVQDLLARGRLHRHPRTGRNAERYGLHPADAKDYLRPELTVVFQRLERLGLSRPQVRVAALELLHEEEWDVAPPEQASHGARPEAAPAPAAPAIGAHGPAHRSDVGGEHHAGQPHAASQHAPAGDQEQP